MRFQATLSASGSGGGRWVELPFDGKDAFGSARAPVRGTLNGAPFRGRLAVYGGRTYLGLNREVREAAGLELGDQVDVVLELDDTPREIDVPAALVSALAADAEARTAYERLSYTHRREYATWIAEAKREETRARRVAKALDMLRAGAKS